MAIGKPLFLTSLKTENDNINPNQYTRWISTIFELFTVKINKNSLTWYNNIPITFQRRKKIYRREDVLESNARYICIWIIYSSIIFSFEWHVFGKFYTYAESLLEFFRMNQMSVPYQWEKFKASCIVRYTLILCHQFWTISSIQWKNFQALNSLLTVLLVKTFRNPLYLIICPLHLFIRIIWT